MKKLILFLLLPLWAIAQTSTTQEQEFDYGIKNNSAQTITTPPYLTTTGIDGTQGKIPSALIEKTDNKQNSLAVDGTGTKYPTVDAVNAALPKTYATIVYVNTTSPTTATVFDDENPPTVNDTVLKTNVANLYIGTDGSKWVYKTSPAGYVTEVVPDGSNFYLYNTTTDAGNNKTAFISRTGGIKTTGTLEGNTLRGTYLFADGETANTIAGFDGARQLKSLPTITYPSLTELSYVKGVTSGIQSQINNKADLDGSGKVPLSQINDALLGSVNYKGTYNATTNVPAIPTATSSNKGWYYIISTSGTQQGFNFVNGDWIISNGISWGKVDNNNAVASVNGQVGAVNLTKSDVGLSSVDNTSDANKPISTATQTALNSKAPVSGSTNYIQNQNASAQSANMWISGTGRFDSSVTAQNASGNVFSAKNTVGGFINLGINSNASSTAYINYTNSLDFTGGAVTFDSSISAPSYTGSATLTGTPTAPTAPVGTNTTQIATTAFVQAKTNGLGKTLLLDKTITTYNAVSTGAQQIIKTWVIPANTIPADCILKLTIKTSRLLGSGNPFMSLKINGSTGWLNGLNENTARRNIIINDTTYDYHHASGTFIDDITSPTDYSNFPINRGVDNTLTLNMDCGVTGNIFKFYYIMIEIVKQ